MRTLKTNGKLSQGISSKRWWHGRCSRQVSLARLKPVEMCLGHSNHAHEAVSDGSVLHKHSWMAIRVARMAVVPMSMALM